MRKIWCLLVAIVSIGYTSVAQDVENFIELKSSGNIPEDFTTLSTDKFNQDYNQNRDKNLDKDFFLNTRFFIDELLLSGRVLFNDPVTKYLNKVAKQVLRREKKLLKELRFYVLKSTAVNAFSTDQGIIFFTTGLMAQLENEAQLAYIIAHEVSHYTEKHVKESYVERQNLEKSRGRYKRLSYDEAVDQLSTYNKDNELEADQKGIDLYLGTQYAVDEVFSSFEVLLYSYLPFDERVFDSTWFDTEFMQIPGSFFPDTIRQITLEEDYDDEGSTHPNIKTRIERAADYIGDKNSRGDKKFLVGEEEFKKVRTLARFELINLELSSRNYGEALYEIYILQEEFPDNKFLDLSFVKCLYGLAKYKNHGRYNEVTPKIKKVEGESYVLHKFLRNISRAQLNVITYRHLHDMKQKYPNDPIFDDYYQDFKIEFAMNSKVKFDELKSENYDVYNTQLDSNLLTFDVEDSIKKVDASDLSKFQKIKLKKKLRSLLKEDEELNYDDDFHLFALNDLVREHNLIDDLKETKRKEELRIEEEEKKEEELAKQRARKGYHLGIKNLMVIDPIYENYTLKGDVDHLKSEDKKVSISDIYSDNYRKLDLETTVLDSKTLNTSDINQYNDLGLIKMWVAEVLDHEEIDMISSTRTRMRDIVDSYGTSKFLFSGIYGYKERTRPSMWHLYGIMMVYTAPLALGRSTYSAQLL